MGTSCAKLLVSMAIPASSPNKVGNAKRESKEAGFHQSMTKKQENIQNVSGGLVRKGRP